MLIKSKKIDHTAIDALVSSGINPHLARFYSARGIKHIDDVILSIEKIIPPETLTNKDRKSTRLNSSHIPLSRMPSSA